MHRNYTAPPAPGYSIAGRTVPGRDLTGRVRKSSDYYFAAGGFADLWEGQMMDEPENQQEASSWGVRISNILSYFLRFVPGGTHSPGFQGWQSTDSKLKTVRVAVKILRNVTIGVPEANGERLARVR
jgi:hypothetical protein